MNEPYIDQTLSAFRAAVREAKEEERQRCLAIVESWVMANRKERPSPDDWEQAMGIWEEIAGKPWE